MNSKAEVNPRYSRQVILPGVGLEGQQRIQQSRILVVGLGGLGSPASMYLAAAGVGTLGIADNDTVEESNLHRQILHDIPALGKSKIASARARLQALNPDLTIIEHPDGITPENAGSVFAGYDLVVDGTDNFPTRYLINDAAFLARKPVVYGSIFQFEGQVSVFHPSAGTPCYRCLFPELPEPGTVPNCAEAGVFGALCGIVGSWQASEAIKWVSGIGEPLTGRMKVLDTLSCRDRIVHLKKDTGCPLCGDNPTIREVDAAAYGAVCRIEDTVAADALPMEIDVQTTAGLLKGPQAPEILDVREPFEREICRLGDDRHIPTGEIQFNWKELPRDQHLLVLCHHGVRSLYVTRFLREKGFHKVQSIQGGIHAWSKEIDPSVPRY